MSKEIIFLDVDKTLDYIISQKKSIARYGDGELINFIYSKEGINNNLFREDFNENLSRELFDILAGRKSNNLVVAIYPCLTQEHFQLSKIFDRNHSTTEKLNLFFMNFFKNYGFPDNILGDAFCFRKNRCNEDQKRDHKNKIINFFKDKKVLTLSSMTREKLIEIGFYKNFDILEIPESNLYKKIDEIEQKAYEIFTRGNYDLITCSGGPAATVLANRFANKNIMFWDIGQINRA